MVTQARHGKSGTTQKELLGKRKLCLCNVRFPSWERLPPTEEALISQILDPAAGGPPPVCRAGNV